MREPRDDGPFPDFEGKTPAKRPPGGKPPCFIRIYFPRERFNFQIRPSAKVESEPFFDLQESKVESRFDFGQIRPPKRLSKTLFQRKSNLKVEFRFDFGKSRVFKTQPKGAYDGILHSRALLRVHNGAHTFFGLHTLHVASHCRHAPAKCGSQPLPFRHL